jgi:tRNA(Ser,Leu) C12 N-acetylase TAN1
MGETGVQDWNVVVTVYRDADVRRALETLAEYGLAEESGHRHVLVMKTAGDVEAFADRFADRLKAHPELMEHISRVAPCQVVFDFSTAAEFERRAEQSVLDWGEILCGASFCVRVNRRGFKGELDEACEERFLDGVIMRRLEELGDPGRVCLADPDFVIDVETVGGRAGMSVWTREEREWLPFLRVA